MTAVLTAVGHRWDSRVATVLEGSGQVRIARRCADLADLMAAAAAGLGVAALVSDDLRGLDLSAVDQLRSAGLRVVGVSTDDEPSERRLRQLGITQVVPASAPLASFEAALLERGPQQTPAPWGPAPPGPLAEPASPPQLEGAPADESRLTSVAPAPRGRIVAVWGPTGAPGRTTVAVNLAAEMAQLGTSTLLVDADTYGGSIAQTLSLLDEAPGLAAATRAAEQGTLDLPMLARLSPEVRRGLRVLTGIPKAERWPEIRPAALERVLDLGRSLADTVVVDCGFNLEDDEELSYDTQAPRRNAAALTVLAAADSLVAVGGCDPVSLQRLVRGLQQLRTTRAPAPVVLVNRVRAAAVGARPEQRVREAMSRFAGVDELRFVPDDPASLDAAMLAGRSLVESAPLSPARQAIAGLAAALLGVAPVRTASRRLRR